MSAVDVQPLVRQLVYDRTVSLFAMTALQRTIGLAPMAQVLRELITRSDDEQVVTNARRQLKRVERKLQAKSQQ